MSGQKIFQRIVFIALFFLAGNAFSQDIHFTQFYASPLTLNPALTGKMFGDYRLSAIYRGQYKSFTDGDYTAYATPAASFDIPFVFGKKRTNAIGAGILFVNDITNNKRLNTLQLQVSVAYHKALDKDRDHQMSIGLQGGIRQTNVKVSEFRFGNQIIDGVYDPTLPTDNISDADASKTIPDINTGFFYSGRLFNDFTLFTGFSLFHLGEPNQSIFQNRESKLPMRYVVHGGVDWKITERFSLLPGVIFMSQAEAREINFGTNVGFEVSQTPNKEAALYLGVWHRWDDAISPMLAVELLKRFRIGASYDISTSAIADATDRKGGFEISVLYIGQILKIQELNLFSPRF